MASTAGVAPELLFTTSARSVEPPRFTLCAALPFNVSVPAPVKLSAPEVRTMFPATDKPLIPSASVPLVSVRSLLTANPMPPVVVVALVSFTRL